MPFEGEKTVVLERGPHHRREQFIQQIVDAKGDTQVVTNEYTVLGTGLHFFDQGKWQDTQPTFEEFEDGFVARHSAHKGIIKRQLLQAGAVDVVDPDGRRLQATPSMLVFRNRVTGDAIELARVAATEGQLDNPTTIRFPKAFDRLDADVEVKWSAAGLECDVIVRQTLPDPSSLGMDPELTDFEVLTEFFDTEPSARSSIIVPVGKQEKADSNDPQPPGRRATSEQFEFGQFSMRGGEAILLPGTPGNEAQGSRGTGIPVRRTLHNEGPRRLLLESIPYNEAKELLRSIPLNGAMWKPAPGTIPGKLSAPVIPGAHEIAEASWEQKLSVTLASGGAVRREVVATDAKPRRSGMLVDWPINLSSATSYTFESGKSYYVDTDVFLGGSQNGIPGTVVFGPDVVVKYKPGTKIQIRGSLANGQTHFAMNSDLYRPVVFVSKDDNSLGETVSGSTGNPVNGAAIALEFEDAGYVQPVVFTGRYGISLQHFRIRNAQLGIKVNGGWFHQIRHGQFVNCGAGISASYIWNTGLGVDIDKFLVVNCLFAKCINAIGVLQNASITAHFWTFDPTTQDSPVVGSLNNSTFYLWNSIVANTTALPSGVVYLKDPNVELSADSWLPGPGVANNPFNAVGSGGYYLKPGVLGRMGAIIPGFDNNLFKVSRRDLTVNAPEVLTTVAVPLVLRSKEGTRWTDNMSRGYRYPAIDYIAAQASVSSALTLVNPVVLAVGGTYGFRVTGNGSIDASNDTEPFISSYGRQTNVFTRISAVQEQAIPVGMSNPSYSSLLELEGSGAATFKATVFIGGLQTPSHRYLINWSQGTGRLKLRDVCLMSMSIFQQPYYSTATPKFQANNCLFYGTKLQVSEVYATWPQSNNLELWNNLFLNCTLDFGGNGYSTWNIRDNLFGDSTLSANNVPTTTCSYNAFKATTALPGANNRYLTVLDWAKVSASTGAWRYYYPPTGGHLSQLRTAISPKTGTGSRSAASAGLYHYTVDSENLATKRQNGDVHIGLHHPALTAATYDSSSGQFANSEYLFNSANDSIADIDEDLDGDGIPDAGETNWQTFSVAGDLDGDGLTPIDEAQFGSLPLQIHSDTDGMDDWFEARERTNPRKPASLQPQFLDRFGFNGPSFNSEQGRQPTSAPQTAQIGLSFEGKGLVSSTGLIPITYPLNPQGKPAIDLSHGTVRFWYIPTMPLNSTAPRTLIHVRGTPAGFPVHEWKLEMTLNQSSGLREIRFSSSAPAPNTTVVRDSFAANLPPAADPGQEVFEICLSYMGGICALSVNGVKLPNKLVDLSGAPILCGVDYQSAVRLEGSLDATLTIGARKMGSGNSISDYDNLANGMIDDVEWSNAAICSGTHFAYGRGPWGHLVDSEKLRRYGGWAVAQSSSVELHLRRGWEGPIGTLSIPGSGYQIQRREFGLTGDQDWVPINMDTRNNVFQDSSVTPGRWYEYRLPLTSKNFGHSIWGYAGSKPSPSTPTSLITGSKKYGIVVGVDSKLLEWDNGGPLRAKITEYVNTLKTTFGTSQVVEVPMARMNDDQGGDGRLDRVNAGTATEAANIYEPGHAENIAWRNSLALNKTTIWNAFSTMGPLHTRIIALVGHVAVPMSGHAAEDGHTLSEGTQPSHEGAWPCDAWYGVPTGANWTDNGSDPMTGLPIPPPGQPIASSGLSRYLHGLGGTTDGTLNANGVPRTDWEIRNVANDGKFDANFLPGPLEAAVGRMDFSKMPGYTTPEDGSDEDTHKRRELRLTRLYLEKALAWRQSLAWAGNPNRPSNVAPMPADETHCYLFSLENGVNLPKADLNEMSIPAVSASVRQNNGKLPRSGTRDLFRSDLPAWDTPDVFTTWGIHGGYGGYDAILGWYGQRVSVNQILNEERRAHSCVNILYGSFFGDWNHEAEDLGPILNRMRQIYIADSSLQKAILAQTRPQSLPITQPISGLVTIYCGIGLNPSRPAAGFPVGCMMIDTSRDNPWYSARFLGILGDPTLILK